jgi:hypothetical protein
MVINDLDLVGFPFRPDKTDAVLIVDAYAVLPLSLAFQLFEAISRRTVQIFKIRGGVQQYELSVCIALNCLRDSS